MKKWDDYVYPNGVLKNKLGITDSNALYAKEAEIVIEKLSDIILNSYSGNFDINHLRSIHKYLFEDIYDFAGEFREVEIYKPNSNTRFATISEIVPLLEKLLTNARAYDKESKSKFEISQFLGDFYYKLIQIHPFREGNGRTIREFLREYVASKLPEYELDYSKIDKKNFLLGVTDYESYPSLLAFEIYNALVPVKETRK